MSRSEITKTTLFRTSRSSSSTSKISSSKIQL